MHTDHTIAGHTVDQSQQAEAVQNALSRTIDVRAGYDVMVDKAEPEFRSTALKFRETHHQHAERLSALVTALGGTPDVDGGVMSTVNKTVVSLRAMFDEIDDDVMDRVRDGEEHVIDAFDSAIGTLSAGRYHDELVAMRDELRELIAQTAPAY